MTVLLETPSNPNAPYLELRAVDFEAALELYFLDTNPKNAGWDATWVTLGGADIVQYERLMNDTVILYLPTHPAELQVIKGMFGWFAIGLVL